VTVGAAGDRDGDESEGESSLLWTATVLFLLFFGVNVAVSAVLQSVLRALLVDTTYDTLSNASVVVAVAVTVVLVRRHPRPSVWRVWAFGLVTSLGMGTLNLVGGGVPELSGSLYPVVRQSLLAVAALSFAGVVTWPGTLRGLRRYVDPLSDVGPDDRGGRRPPRER
jgi:hypothetical protein